MVGRCGSNLFKDFQLLLGNPEALPGQMGYITPPSEFWVYPSISCQVELPQLPLPKGTADLF